MEFTMLISKIVMPIDITAQAPASMSELWGKSISDKADLINQRRLTRIPDEETFLNMMADASELTGSKNSGEANLTDKLKRLKA